MTEELSDADDALLGEALKRFGEDLRRTFGERWEDISVHAACRVFAGLLSTTAGAEMFGLANAYLTRMAVANALPVAPQLRLVPVSDLLGGDADESVH